MPTLETSRLVIRPFTLDDLAAVYQILDIELGDTPNQPPAAHVLADRQRWLQWTVLNYVELENLHQPPYGDRAVVDKQTGQLIGACGLAPALLPFEQLPAFHQNNALETSAKNTHEFGLYWAISTRHQRQGFAAEAGQALIDFAFSELNLKRIVATTNYDNHASIGVMRKLGMDIQRNPFPDPPWMQVVGFLVNTANSAT